MAFNHLLFVFMFLPITVLLYHVVPRKLRALILVLVSLVFYAWGNPSHLIFLAVSMVFNYITGIQIGLLQNRGKENIGKLVLITSVAANLAMLVVFKYFRATMPIGLSFYTFTALSYLFDVWRREAEPQRNPLSFALYMSFFVKISSGPIVRYRDMKDQLSCATADGEATAEGLRLFLIGLMKKVLIADNLGAVFAALGGFGFASTGSAWLGLLLYSFQLYFDFSGYSDMAIGLARMFGFTFAKNFDYPYRAKSISDFWRRWHISLGMWFRHYVYIPLGGSRKGSMRLLLNLLIVWALTGLWHGSTINFLLWGLYHGVLVIIDKFIISRFSEHIPTVVRILVTVFFACLGWVFFFTPTVGDAVTYFQTLFGGGAVLMDPAGLYYLRQSIVLLIIAIIGSGPAVHNLYHNIFFRNSFGLPDKARTAIPIVIYAVLVVSCIACMISSTYSAFLYFKF